MRNLRGIKKDIEYLTSEVISDCLVYLDMNDNAHEEEVSKIISDSFDLRDDVVVKINKYPREGAAKYFKALETEMVASVDALFEKLSKISGEGKAPEAAAAAAAKKPAAKKPAAEKPAAEAKKPAAKKPAAAAKKPAAEKKAAE